jgi:hypothetical protein
MSLESHALEFRTSRIVAGSPASIRDFNSLGLIRAA